MSFLSATLVLSIGETVEEVTDSGFLGTTLTLSTSLLGDDIIVQVKFLRYKYKYIFEFSHMMSILRTPYDLPWYELVF